MWHIVMTAIWFVMAAVGVKIYITGHWIFDLILCAISTGMCAFHIGKVLGWW